MAQNSGGRSDTERHWDQICIAGMTIGTAALAAVIILYNPASMADGDITITDVVRATMVGTAAVAYAFLVAQGIRTIFLDERTVGKERERRKKDYSASTFSMMGAITILIVAMVLMEITISTFVPWLEESKRAGACQVAEGPEAIQEETKPKEETECPPVEPPNHAPKAVPQNGTHGHQEGIP